MTDQQYLAYLRTKTVGELTDIRNHFNRWQNPARFQAIEAELNERRASDPGGYAEHAAEAKYETVGRRFLAALVDGIIVWVCGVGAAFLLVRFDAALFASAAGEAVWFVCILLPVTCAAKTVGMHLTGLRVYDRAEREASWQQRLLRESIFVVPPVVLSLVPESLHNWLFWGLWLNFAAVSLVNPVFIYVHPRHYALNDLIAKTVILRGDRHGNRQKTTKTI